MASQQSQVSNDASHSDPLALASPQLRNHAIRARWEEQKQQILERRRHRETARQSISGLSPARLSPVRKSEMSPNHPNSRPISPVDSTPVKSFTEPLDTIEVDHRAQQQAMQWLNEHASPHASPLAQPSPSLFDPVQQLHQQASIGLSDAVMVVLDQCENDASFREHLLQVLQGNDERESLEHWCVEKNVENNTEPPNLASSAASSPLPTSPPRVMVPFSPRPGELIGAQWGIFSGWSYLIRTRFVRSLAAFFALR